MGMLKTTTESPEAWLDRFYSKNIRTVPRKMVSSVKLFTSVDDGNEEEEKENFSSTSHSERHALRELLALVGSEEATLVEVATATRKTTTTTKATTTRKPVLITTSAQRVNLSSASSTTKAKTQG